MKGKLEISRFIEGAGEDLISAEQALKIEKFCK